MSSFVWSLGPRGDDVVFFPSLAAFSAYMLAYVLLTNSKQKNRQCQWLQFPGCGIPVTSLHVGTLSSLKCDSEPQTEIVTN